MTYPTDRPATWLVTGASRGLGLELVRQLLERGDQVTATTRSTERLLEALDGVDTTRLHAVAVDLTDQSAVDAAVAATQERFGGLDVVVNNAGYGFLGAVEETTDAEVREMFDVQVFGLWNVLRSVLPIFRSARSGHVINVSSILGLTAFPGWGAYVAAKFAVEGLSETLAAEVAGLGVTVTAVAPGYFNTSFLTSDSLKLPASTTAGYEDVRAMTDAHLAMPGTQLGDPVKAATAIISVAVDGDSPLHQVLGSDSYSLASAKVDALRADLEAGRELAHTTDYVRS